MKNQHSMPPLATIRQNRGISLEQIAASTKISVRALEAIEEGHFGKLPGGIYTTSYIRQYARAIDYDEMAILNVYRLAMDPANPGVPSNRGDGGFPGLSPAGA